MLRGEVQPLICLQLRLRNQVLGFAVELRTRSTPAPAHGVHFYQMVLSVGGDERWERVPRHKTAITRAAVVASASGSLKFDTLQGRARARRDSRKAELGRRILRTGHVRKGRPEKPPPDLDSVDLGELAPPPPAQRRSSPPYCLPSAISAGIIADRRGRLRCCNMSWRWRWRDLRWACCPTVPGQ